MSALRLKTLLIEDNDLIRPLSERMLEKMGCQIVAAVENAEVAWAILQGAGKGSIDLVVSDNTLPGMSGVELLALVRDNEATKELPFVILTGDLDHDGELQRKIEGMQGGYFQKPAFRETYEQIIAYAEKGK